MRKLATALLALTLTAVLAPPASAEPGVWKVYNDSNCGSRAGVNWDNNKSVPRYTTGYVPGDNLLLAVGQGANVYSITTGKLVQTISTRTSSNDGWIDLNYKTGGVRYQKVDGGGPC